jgi:hypothetical protein
MWSGRWRSVLARRDACVFGTFTELRKATISFVVSVRPSTSNSSVPIGRIFMKLDIWACLENLSRNFKFHWNVIRMTGTLHEDVCTFMIISPRFLLGIRGVSGKRRRKAQNTHLILPPPFFRISCLLWDTVEKYDRARQATDDSIIRRLCVAAWIPKTTEAHERAWMLWYAYTAYLVNAYFAYSTWI